MPDQDSRVTTSFETTPKMSTYLIAFLISDFSVISKNNHSLYARPNAIHEGNFALEIENKILTKLEDLTNVPYIKINTHKKLDLVALPEYLYPAMEHLGLIFLRL